MFTKKETTPGNLSFFKSTENTSLPEEIAFDERIFLKFSQIAKLEISRDGFSTYYPDSYFKLEFDNSGYWLTRRKLEPQVVDKTDPPSPPVEITFDEPIFLDFTQIGELEINHDGISKYYPDSYFKVEFNNSGYQLTRSKLEPQVVKKTAPPSPPVEIAFDEPIFFDSTQIGKLEISHDGFSKYYPDSYFKLKCEQSGYWLTRRKWSPQEKVKIPLLENSESGIELNNFPRLQKEAATLPIYAIKKFPEENWIGTGNMGQVHQVSSKEGSVALKLDRLIHDDVKQGRTFTLNPDKVKKDCILVNPLTNTKMHLSFSHCHKEYKAIKDIPQSDFIAGVKGIVFVEELNQWGLLYEYVEGYHFKKYCEDLKEQDHSTKYLSILDLSLQLTQGLKILDEAGFAHTDLLEDNILVRNSNFTPVLIDYTHSAKQYDSVSSQKSRKQFGTRLSQLAQKLDHDEPELNKLIKDCQSELTMDELSWGNIQEQLQQIKSSQLAAKADYTPRF